MDPATALTIFYSGEEHGQLGLHGCGSKQVGGLAHSHTLIENLYIKHPGAVLNLHTGNLIDATDENAIHITYFHKQGCCISNRSG